MKKLQIFESDEFGKIRTATIDDEPWFVAKDISDKLGYAQTSNMMKRIDEEDSKSSILDGMNMKSLLINESGLYSAILGSKLKSAKRFKHWVTSEVLPSIRKTGQYAQKKLSPIEQLQLVQQATLQVHEEVEELRSDLNDFKETMPLLGVDMDALKKAVNTRVVDALGGIQSNAYKNKSVRANVYSDCWNELKRQFGFVKSYKEMKRNQLDQAISVVKRYQLPLVLEELVEDENAQLHLECCEYLEKVSKEHASA